MGKSRKPPQLPPRDPRIPRTIATIVQPDQAEAIMHHLQGCLESGAGVVLLYTSLEDMIDDPQDMKDFPAPDLYIDQEVFIIGIQTEYKDFVAMAGEHMQHMTKEDDSF
jgi:hypothetical protein